MEMTSRLSLIDLDVQLIYMMYDKPVAIEHLLELLEIEFPDDAITMDELTEWAGLGFEIEELERCLEFSYSENLET